jgi:hypothetical protein
MVDSISGLTSTAVTLQQKISQNIGDAVLKKSQDIQVEQGQAALQLLASAKIPQGIVDVHV